MAGWGARIRRWCGVKLTGDLYERACNAGFCLPLDRKRRQRLRAIDQARTLFIHIPKNAGMSISAALYGEQIKHATIRYYRRAAPRLVRRMTSFAVLRDPVERFVSSFHYAQAGASADNKVAAPFCATYMRFATIDDALDHLERTRSIYHVDHIFRPQSWYISDRRGRVIVDRLFLIDDMEKVQEFLHRRAGTDLVHLNATPAVPVLLRPEQIKRIERLYPEEVAIVARLRRPDGMADAFARQISERAAA